MWSFKKFQKYLATLDFVSTSEGMPSSSIISTQKFKEFYLFLHPVISYMLVSEETIWGIKVSMQGNIKNKKLPWQLRYPKKFLKLNVLP